MSNKEMNDFALVSTPKLSDYHWITQNGVLYRCTSAQILSLFSDSDSGVSLSDLEWTADSNTWTYLSPPNEYCPFAQVRIAGDATGYLFDGMDTEVSAPSKGTKIRYYQSDSELPKYGIVVDVGEYTTYTDIIFYTGGTYASPSYELINATITTPAYATTDHPTVFPYDEDTWSTVFESDTVEGVTQSTSYNYPMNVPSGANICLGPGKWELTMTGLVSADVTYEYCYAYFGFVTAGSISETLTSQRCVNSSFDDNELRNTIAYSGSINSSGYGDPVDNLDPHLTIKKIVTLDDYVKYWSAGQIFRTSLTPTGYFRVGGSLEKFRMKARCLSL